MYTQSTVRRMSPSVLAANDTASMRYNYLDRGEFRLIKILPGRQEDPEDMVRCQLFPRTLSNCPEYVALSYAWGDVSDTHKVLIERTEVSVSASLESALRALRDPGKSKWVWADAISINQEDPSERASQVRLMTRIYQEAKSVAIWLGPQSGNSDLGMELIENISKGAAMPLEITKSTPAPFKKNNFAAVVALFDREYWHRLWVVQEVFNARTIKVYCGPVILPWKAFQTASKIFREHRDVLERSFHPRYINNFYQAQTGSYAQVLVHGGPGSLAGVGTPEKFRGNYKLSDREVFQDLLEVMHTCRRKLTSEPRDKIFGVLGVLAERIRNEIKVDYSIPVKDVYMNIFRTVVEKTESLDILCQSIHFPTYINNNNLPSWVPDWSHVSNVSPIATMYEFSASENSQVVADFTIINKLKISAIPLGFIERHGIAVGTLCTLNDYLMAFLQWRACLLHFFDGAKEDHLPALKRRFCLTLSLEHAPEGFETPEIWMEVCHHVFASTIRNRLPKLQMDHELEQYIELDRRLQMDDKEKRTFIQEYFGKKMMGRCFCITNEGRLGLGTGFIKRGDVVVVPLGCSTPVVLRPEGDGYRFVGDVYIDGYMNGAAVKESTQYRYVDKRIRSYVIH